MTEQDIETAFAEAVQSKAFKKHPDFTKFDRYDLKNKTSTTARKLETLWKLGKLKLT